MDLCGLYCIMGFYLSFASIVRTQLIATSISMLLQ
uniref:Uncharacterized protein n=1 Tax=Arundo donax TaxID=35708 RepID=A0A0A9D5L9_ARUDO